MSSEQWALAWRNDTASRGKATGAREQDFTFLKSNNYLLSQNEVGGVEPLQP